MDEVAILAILLPVMIIAIIFGYALLINLLDRYGPPRKSKTKKTAHGHYVDEETLAELLERAERLSQRVANLEEIHRSNQEVA